MNLNKPTQQSVAKLREIGIQPDILICRTEQPITNEIREKISLFCSVKKDAVIEEQDVAHSIYELPHMLKKEGLDELVISILGLDAPTPKQDDWEEVVHRLLNPKHKIKIGMVGKYMDLQDSISLLMNRLFMVESETIVKSKFHIDAEEIEKNGPEALLSELDGILVPGGFGDRGTEGK